MIEIATTAWVCLKISIPKQMENWAFSSRNRWLGLRFQIFVPQARRDTCSAKLDCLSVGEDVAIVPAGEIQLGARRQESKAG